MKKQALNLGSSTLGDDLSNISSTGVAIKVLNPLGYDFKKNVGT